jgi:HlyD family secretion protein
MKQIFPKEIIENTVDAHQFKHSTRSKVIYSIILVSLIVFIVSLPFIKVDIYTSARGIIKPEKERLNLTSLNSGKIVTTYLKNNKTIKKGDTLLVLDKTIINEKLNFSISQIEDVSLFTTDLNYLVSAEQKNFSKIKTPKYKKEFLFFKQKEQELQTRYKKLKQDLDRSKLLFEKGVIAKVDFENVRFDYDIIVNSLYQLKNQQINNWQASLTEYKNNLLEFESSNKQLEENKLHFIVLAPISGTLIGVKSIEKGSFLNGGEIFASISPDTNLLIECFISPTDIGLLKANTAANFQVDAYNYNQWGLASGKIIDISKDIEYLENTSVFKVQCNINEKELILKNGYKGRLKKGMTVSAQFKLAERTLFDLLYDKLDDWVNPSQNTIAINN